MEQTKKLTQANIFAILLVPFCWIFEASMIGPSLASLQKAFPSVPTFGIQFLQVAPFVTSIVFSVVSGRLAKYLDKKVITVAGLLIYSVVGTAPALASSYAVIVLLRMIMGIGVGLVLPMPNAYISDYFEGKKRERFFGYATAVANVANIVTALLVGVLLTWGWRFIFAGFSLIFVVMIISIIFLPASPPQKKPDHPESEGKANRAEISAETKSPGIVYAFAIFMALSWLFFGFCVTNNAFYMTEYKTADSFMIGIASMFPATGSMVAGLIYPSFHRLCKKWLAPVCIAIFATGYLVMFTATKTVFLVILANFMIGIGQSTFVPFLLDLTAQKTTAAQHDKAQGIVSGGMHFGWLFSPFAQVGLQMVFHNSTTRFFWAICFVLLYIIGAITLLFTLRVKNPQTGSEKKESVPG